MIDRLPSEKYICGNCPNCGELVTHIRNDRKDEHHYLMDIRDIDFITCPLCNYKIRLSGEYLLAPTEN